MVACGALLSLSSSLHASKPRLSSGKAWIYPSSGDGGQIKVIGGVVELGQLNTERPASVYRLLQERKSPSPSQGQSRSVRARRRTRAVRRAGRRDLAFSPSFDKGQRRCFAPLPPRTRSEVPLRELLAPPVFSGAGRTATDHRRHLNPDDDRGDVQPSTRFRPGSRRAQQGAAKTEQSESRFCRRCEKRSWFCPPE